jgi:lysozyme
MDRNVPAGAVPLHVSDKGLMELISHEGIVLTPYYDSKGILTWGVGHTAMAGDPTPAKQWGRTAPLKEVFEVFRKDVERYAGQVRLAFTAPLSQAQFDAAVSFHFNTGAISKATWVKKFNAGDMAGAKKSFMDWRKPAEILPRRKKEFDLFFGGIYSGGGQATVYPANEAGTVQWGKGRKVDLAAALRGADPPVPAPAPKPIPAEPIATPDEPAKRNGLAVLIALVITAIVAFAGMVSGWAASLWDKVF